MEMWTILAVLVLIAVLAPRYGVDSRWPARGEPPPPPRPRPSLLGDVVRLAHRLGGPATWR
jgi:hypothetical protein